MDVGVVANVRFLPSAPEPLESIYRKTVEVAVLAEELGFSHYWVSETHLAEDAWSPSPLVILAGVATRTSRIRLGTYVTLIGMHHPIRLAEDAATVDVLSNGRLDLGFGAAMIEEQGKAFNIDVKGFFSRAYEAAAVLQKCFTEKEFTHEGKYFNFQNVRMTTKSVQKPHPPIFWAAMGPKSLVEAAERNYGLASAMESPLWTMYMDKQRELGRRRPADFKVISGPLFGHLAEDREKAWDDCEAGLHWIVEYYNKFGMNIPLAPLGQFRKPENAVIHGKPLAIGTPDEVLRILSAFRNEPMDELAIEFYHPGQDVESVKRSLRLFAKEVLPEVKRWKTP